MPPTHVFYIPAQYGPIFYAVITGAGLILSLYVGLAQHPKELLLNSCGPDHYEFWPSISACIGDFLPERQIWRVSFVLCACFRIAASMNVFNVFWQKGCGGMADIYALRHQPRQLLASSAFITLAMVWIDLWRLIGAVCWTMVASRESLAYHNVGFVPYVALCFLLQVCITVLCKRNQYNTSIYPSLKDAVLSLKIKRLAMYGEAVMSLGVTLFFLRHFATCAPGSFSLSTMCEWCFAFFNLLYDGCCFYEVKTEGWWMSTTPEKWLELTKNGMAHLSPRAQRSPVLDTSLPSIEVKDGASVLVDIEDDRAKLNGPAVLTNGETFISPDIILHRFNLCNGPSRAMLWCCDIYWWWLFIEILHNLVQHMYYMPLVAMQLSWEIALVGFLGMFVLLRVPKCRKWMTGPCFGARTFLKPPHHPPGTAGRVVPMYVFFFFCASLSHLHMLVKGDAGHKLAALSFGGLFIPLAVVTRSLYPSVATVQSNALDSNDDSRRLIYCLPLSLVLHMLLRILYVSLSPLYTEPLYGAVIGVVLGITYTTVVYRHAMFGNTVRELARLAEESNPVNSLNTSPTASASAVHNTLNSPMKRTLQYSLSQQEELAPNTVVALANSYTPVAPTITGILFCNYLVLMVNLFGSANIIPRMIAIDPFPTSLVVVAVYFLGLWYAMDVLPISPQLLLAREHQIKRLSLMSGILRRLFRASFLRVFSVAMVSCFILLNGTRQTNFTFEKKHDGYPVTTKTDLKDLDIAHWDEQVGFSGSKYLALLAGLVLTFLYGAVSPLITEICLAHQRARRLTILEETGELEAIYRKEPKSVMKSFEFSLGIVFFILGYSYIVAVSYPFIPFGDIMRERTRSVYFVNTTAVFGLVWYVGLRLRRTSRLILDKNIVPAQRQRSIQFFMLVLVGIAFIVVITGRVGLMEEDRSFPAGKTTAVDYRKEVLHIHHIMMDLLVERNRGTDTTLPEYVTEFIKEDYDFKWNEMRKNITETKENEYVNKTYQLNHLNKDVRKDVFAAAEAMSSYIGLIWTVHFGLDNYNVDSFNRMAKWAVKLNAGVIGLLESDAMHFVTGNRDMTEYMSYHTGFRYTDYGSPLIDSTYGCTIISRYPIKSVRRYVLPSPIGELACAVLAELDIYGLTVRTFVGHFGNTEHKADGILQSKYLGKLAKNTVGPAVWLGYLVTHPGESKHYGEYSDPAKPGLFRDAGLDMYVNRPWTELVERGGYHEVPPPFEKKDPEAPHDFDVEFKLHYVKEIAQLEKALGRPPDDSFRRPPANESRRHFYFNATNRYALDHPRFEFMDRYCQYSLYKTGKAKDELPENREKVQPIAAELFDWRRVVEPVADISDTEIQLIQLLFTERTE